MKSSGRNRRFLWLFKVEDLRFFLTILLSMMLLYPISAAAVISELPISDYPLDTQINPAAPNLMLGLDDSGSMDWEVMTAEESGCFTVPGRKSTTYEYVFNDAGDNLYKTGTNSDILLGENRLYWESQWSGVNTVYYNPDITYEPWTGMDPADPDRPKSHPYYNENYFNLNNVYAVVGSAESTTEIDDGDAAQTFGTGSWGENFSGGNKLHYSIDDAPGTASFLWNPNPYLTAGYYGVYVYNRPEDNKDYWNGGLRWYYNDYNAEYIINDSIGPNTVYLSQIAGNNWENLGFYYFDGTGPEKVTVERNSKSGWYWDAGKNDWIWSYFQTIAEKVRFVKYSDASILIRNSHYYIKDTNGDVYLVNLVSSGSKIDFYKLNDANNNKKIEQGELVYTASPPESVTKQLKGRTYAQEKQNFANWYSFYRKRMRTAVAAITKVIPQLKGVNIGIRSINKYMSLAVIPNYVGGSGPCTELMTMLQSFRQDRHPQSSTPLRQGLKKIGEYFSPLESISPSEPVFDVSPLASGDEGACQQNFVIMFSDGADNGGAPGLQNIDGDQGAPYADSVPGTMADVAMYYYINDLDGDATNNKLPGAGFDTARHQHLVTYTVGFGVIGTLNPDDYKLYTPDVKDRIYPVWPRTLNTNAEKIDDLYHTAVNGRGMYLNSKTPQALMDAFQKITDDILAKIGSGASVSINGEELTTSSVIFQSSYATSGWTGDVTAYRAIETGRGPKLWQANLKLSEKSWNDRIILTYDSSDTGKEKKKFRYSDLSAAQKTALTDAAFTSTEETVNWIRGDKSKEQGAGPYRPRPLKDKDGNIIKDASDNPVHSKMADIVHSAPVYKEYKNTDGTKKLGVVFAGGNDGMLHAFNESDGTELFAYIPNLVFSNLKELAKPTYGHRYFIDSTPFVQDVELSGTKKTLLVGGLAKGGKGIYCLDVTDPSTIGAEDSAKSKVVKWEFPNASTSAYVSDMGYSFSKPYLVKVGSKTEQKDAEGNGKGVFDISYKWVVVVGNGYNSANGKAVLFVLDADTGAVLKKLDTKAAGDDTVFPYKNGLSTPNVVDVDADGMADYAYAGDLRGNMWKFHLKTDNPDNWKLSYGTEEVPKPLFTAVGVDTDAVTTPDETVQSITSRPDAMLHCREDMPGYMVVFGTGRYLHENDIGTAYTQSLYGVWDYGDDYDPNEYLGTFDRSTFKVDNSLVNKSALVGQVATDAFPVIGTNTDGTDKLGTTKIRALTKNEMYWAKTDEDVIPDATNPDGSQTKYPENPLQAAEGGQSSDVGWYVDLPISGERMVQDIMIRQGDVIAITTIPDPSDPCAAGGGSVFMEFDACSGGRSDKPKFDINGDGKIDDNDLVTVTINGQKVTIPPSGIHFPSMVFPPMILRAGDGSEIKYLSTAAGDIVIVRETAEKRGIFYWRYYKK